MSIHPQLTELWRTHPTLVNQQGTWHQTAVMQVGDFTFVPLVTSKFDLISHLNILFLRPGLPGAAVQSGDIDNRLKTLFDALRVPQSISELGNAVVPGTGIINCLLEDDRLIAGLKVDTDQLLGGPAGGGSPRDESHVRLIIHVTVKALKQTWANMGLLI